MECIIDRPETHWQLLLKFILFAVDRLRRQLLHHELYRGKARHALPKWGGAEFDGVFMLARPRKKLRGYPLAANFFPYNFFEFSKEFQY